MERFLSKKDVIAIVRVSAAEIARREKKGAFPARIRDQGRVFWIASEIERYVLDKIAAARRAPPAPHRS